MFHISTYNPITAAASISAQQRDFSSYNNFFDRGKFLAEIVKNPANNHSISKPQSTLPSKFAAI